MPTTRLQNALHCLRKAALCQDLPSSDAQLLALFVEHGNEAAFATLVRRHGPMVWGVCSRTVAHHQDAEDAFQAAFFVLARKAGSVRQRDLLANWLYGVARRTALHAKSSASKRRTRETQLALVPEPQSREQDAWRSLEPLIDTELGALPEKYRIAILLCDLQGKTGKEAARQLKLPEGTLASRLRKARVLLAKRLSRHGLAVSGGALATMLSHHAATAQAPAALLSTTIKAAPLFAAGQTAAWTTLSAKAVFLMERTLKVMVLSKVKSLVLAALLFAILALGAGALYHSDAAAQPVPDAKNDASDSRTVLPPSKASDPAKPQPAKNPAKKDAKQPKIEGELYTYRFPVADLVIPINGLDFPAVLTDKKEAATKEDWLIRKITQTVAPASWKERGGMGTLHYYPLDQSLLVLNSPRVQAQVRYLLETMRRVQDVQVATETRILALDVAGFQELQRLLPRLKKASSAVLTELEAFALLRKSQDDKNAKVIPLPKITLFPGQQALLRGNLPEDIKDPSKCDLKLRAFVGSNLQLIHFEVNAKLGALTFKHETHLQDGETLAQFEHYGDGYVVLMLTPRVILSVEDGR